MKRLHLIIKGEVQGVFFRDYVKKSAGVLRGWVRNNPDGTVEAVAEGSEEELKKFLEKCSKGPEPAVVERIEKGWSDAKKEFDSFEILQ